MKNKAIVFKLLIIILCAILIYSLYRRLTLEDLSYFYELLMDNKNKTETFLTFFIISTFATILFIPVSWIKITGGLLLEFWPALILSWLAVNLGGILVFLICRFIAKSFFTNFLKTGFRGNSGSMIDALGNVEKNGLTLVMNLQMLPIIPCSVVNILCGISKVSFKNYLSGSLLGTIPGTFTAVYFSSKITEVAYDPYSVILPLILFAGFNLAVYLYSKKQSIFETLDKSHSC
jgi:uncharacterized membrane protein YdjX (TVP38/TMEM64 family)